MNGNLLHKKRALKPKDAPASEAALAPMLPMRPSEQRAPHELDRARAASNKEAQDKDRQEEQPTHAGRQSRHEPAAATRAPGSKVRFFEARPGRRGDAQAASLHRPGVHGRAGSADLWRAWVENAYAAWKDGRGGAQSSDVLTALTGQPCHARSTQDATEALWRAMGSALAAGRPVAAIAHGGEDDPDEPKRRRARWFAVAAVHAQAGQRCVEIEAMVSAEATEVIEWPEFLQRFAEVVIAE